MTNLELFNNISLASSKLITQRYSTSFSFGIKMMDKRFHDPIYGIYGFVRLADEIVDTFHMHNKAALLQKFKEDTWLAINEGISLNPVLQSFQMVVNHYKIDHDLIATFLKSMEMDLAKVYYDSAKYDEYILGSAEVVGLMCLKVFCDGNLKLYNQLKTPAMKLGAAFQKINFLRDIQADYETLGRTYFPNVQIEHLDDNTKRAIELDIEKDFRAGYEGILKLPSGSRIGVYIAYAYYYSLFKKIKTVSATRILKERIRIPDLEKYLIMIRCYISHNFNLI